MDARRRSLQTVASTFALAVATLVSLGCGSADAQSAPTTMTLVDSETLGEEWLRVRRDDAKKPLALQSAIVRYVPASEYDEGKDPGDYRQYVDLVGAIHIGDRAYYDLLNRRFRSYDKVLYELVAEADTHVSQGSGTSSGHPVGALQNGLKSMLEVEHQLEHIDYTRKNFVHADLSPDEFMESMEDRDESFLQMYFRMLGASLAHQSQLAARGESADFDLMAALLSDDRPRKLKIAMAQQFENIEALAGGFSGPNGSTLVTARNERALDVLEKELGEGTPKMAIFYGALHFPEMHQQIVERFDMKPVAILWIDAWDLREK